VEARCEEKGIALPYHASLYKQLKLYLNMIDFIAINGGDLSGKRSKDNLSIRGENLRVCSKDRSI
jgi:hypothetical protein